MLSIKHLLSFKHFLSEEENPRIDGNGTILTYPGPEQNKLDRLLTKKYKWKHHAVYALKHYTDFDKHRAEDEIHNKIYTHHKLAKWVNDNYRDEAHKKGEEHLKNTQKSNIKEQYLEEIFNNKFEPPLKHGLGDNPIRDYEGTELSSANRSTGHKLDKLLTKKYKWKHYAVHALKNNTDYNHTNATWNTLDGKDSWQRIAVHANIFYKDECHEKGLKHLQQTKERKDRKSD